MQDRVKHPGMITARAVLALAVATPLAAQVAAGARPRGGPDSATITLRVQEDTLDRKLRELLVSFQRERAMAAALREAEGQGSDPRRVTILSDSVRLLVRRNTEGISELRVTCLRDNEPEGYLGVSFETTEKMRRDGGPVMWQFGPVESVNPGSPAERAGLKRGDVMLSFAGLDARKPMPIENVLKPGAKIDIRVMRGKAALEFTAVAEKRPSNVGGCANLDQLFTYDRAPMIAFTHEGTPGSTVRPTLLPQRARMSSREETGAVAATMQGGGFGYAFPTAQAPMIAGAEMRALDDDGRQALSVDNGVLVVQVLPGTPARQAGLRGLDVIISANGEAVRSLQALRRIISTAETPELQLQIIRGGKTQSISLSWKSPRAPDR